MPTSIPHQKLSFYHLPTRRRAGIKLGDAWYVSNVSIIFNCSMLYYLLFWTLLGFIIHFYITFGTNLPPDKRDPGDLEWTSRKKQGGHEAGRHACPLGAPPPSWAPRSSTDLLLLPIYIYISIYPENIQEHHETLFPPPQPSVPVRSHLGVFSGAPPEGESITDGFYINTIASLMMCE